MRQRRHSHKNELAYKPKKRWFLRKEDGALRAINERLCPSFDASSKWIEIPESELEYWWNKPEGDWEIRKPKERGIFYGTGACDGEYDGECVNNGKPYRASVHISQGYRWCRSLKDRFDVMAEEILGVYRVSPASNRIQSIAYYLRNNWEK